MLRSQKIGFSIAAALSIGVAAIVFSQTRHYGLLGMDAYPIILTSRVTSLADFWGNFSERLMDGLYPGAFYRPVLNFSIAVDYAIWGLRPAGYQLGNALWFAASGLSLYVFLVSRPTPRPPWLSLAGVAVFLLHPLHFEVLPFPPRRPEILATTFVLLALAAESRKGGVWRVLGALATILALGSKESTVILPGLVFLWGLLSFRGSMAQRWRVAAERMAISAFLVGLFLLLRSVILGGVGGHREMSILAALRAFPETLVTTLRTVTSPASVGLGWPLLIWLVVAGGVLAAEHFRAAEGKTRSAYAADILFAVGWMVALGGIFALSGRLAPWYHVALIAPLALGVSAVGEGLVFWSRESIGFRRALALAGAISLGLLVVAGQIRWTPVFRSYEVWQLSAARDAQLFRHIERLLDAAEPGSVTEVWPPKRRLPRDPRESMFRGTVRQSHYSVQAWAALHHPRHAVRVIKNRRALRAEPLEGAEFALVLKRGVRGKRKGKP